MLIELHYHIMQQFIILRKSYVMPPPAQHCYHMPNEIPVSNSNLLHISRFRQLSDIRKCRFLAHVSINAISSEGEVNFM